MNYTRRIEKRMKAMQMKMPELERLTGESHGGLKAKIKRHEQLIRKMNDYLEPLSLSVRLDYIDKGEFKTPEEIAIIILEKLNIEYINRDEFISDIVGEINPNGGAD